MTTEEKYQWLARYAGQGSIKAILCWFKKANKLKLSEYNTLVKLYYLYDKGNANIMENNHSILLINLLYKIVNNYSKNNSK